MDVAASDVRVNLESVVDENKKDRDENEEESVDPPLKKESVDPPLKKRRFDEDTRRVAEIILVLSGLQSIRGGKTPTELEIELMAEAKSKLVDMCQQFRPKDLVGADAIGAMIEDLGLHGKLKDQRLGLTAPKLTISEKLALGKRKMEESEKNPIVSSTSPGHSTSAKNVYVAHQLPKSKKKASTSSVNATGSHLIKDASGKTQSRIERPHIAASQGPPVPDGNATSSSAQPHSSSSTVSIGTASDNKVPGQSSSRETYWSIRPFMYQAPPPFGVSYGQTSSPFGNNQHAEIANLIHTFLQPPAKQNLLGNALPTEFMSRAITCHICQETVNEVETVLICDVCERGFHLKCLKANNVEGVVKSTWHCPRCVQMQLNNGKPFRLTYGRVMKDATPANKSSIGKMDKKVNQEAMPQPETTKPDSAMEQTVEAEDAAKSLLVLAEATPNVQESIHKSVTENPQEDKSC
ncbi:PHD finger protein [Cardamine amara subsp. amara]|uniref:PHD finger protein n=1 Tax=Cardamine amara subsp. amara TaxID=228776 RepID=A0ABD1BTJ7_CARAN